MKIPKVRAKDGKPVTFHSARVPPYVRKARSLEASLPWLYLKGISTGERGEALKMLVGSDAKGLSASAISRLKQEWRKDYTNQGIAVPANPNKPDQWTAEDKLAVVIETTSYIIKLAFA